MRTITCASDCSHCQQKCCYFLDEDKYFAPILTDGEAQFLDKRLLRKNKDYQNVYQIKLIVSKKRKKYFVCPFFNEKNKRCSVYKKRPLDCRLWPIVIAYSKDKNKIEIVCANKNYCPKLKEISKKDFYEYKKYIVSYLNSEPIQNKIKKYPGIIWKHQKDYFKIGEIG